MSDIRVDWALGGWKQSKYIKTIGGKQGIDTDGFYGFQCKDFINAFFATFAAWIPGGNAIDLSTMNLPENVERIRYTAGVQLAPGDVFVENRGLYGHTGVVILLRTGGWISIDQNWFNANDTIGSPPAQVTHDFSKLICVLRIKSGLGGGTDMFNGKTAQQWATDYAGQKAAADERQAFVAGTASRIGALLELPAATDIPTANSYVDRLMAAYAGQKAAADIRLGREEQLAAMVGAKNFDDPVAFQKILDVLAARTTIEDPRLGVAKSKAQEIIDIK